MCQANRYVGSKSIFAFSKQTTVFLCSKKVTPCRVIDYNFHTGLSRPELLGPVGNNSTRHESEKDLLKYQKR